jgi:Fe-S oxidoreductase
MQTESIKEAIRTHRAHYCLDCGKCTSVCPISWRDPSFSPRALVESCRLDATGTVLSDERIWECLTCGRCSLVCPSDVQFVRFVRELRSVARHAHQEGHCTHGATIQTWMRMMADPEIKQERLGWLTGDLRTAAKSDTVYFVGCLPYYDVLFRNTGAQGTEIAQGAVRIMNALGIEPMVLSDERCCGHDLLWEGDTDTFGRLAKLNTESLRATGARRVVTTCPECAYTLRTDYQLGMEVVHITELLAARWDKLAECVTAQESEQPLTVTFQDPCRLGRYMGVYDQPRQLLLNLGLQLAEMDHHGSRSICCGTSAWTQCGATAKCIQVDRLREARATGSDLLVTSCVKCQIHFKCAQNDPVLEDGLRIEVRDLVTLVAERLKESAGS